MIAPMTFGTGATRVAPRTVAAMRITTVLTLLLTFSLTACMHWVPMTSVDEVVGASHVRVVSDGRPPVVLDHPSIESVKHEVESAPHARIEVRALNGWGTALIITAGVLAAIGTAGIILAIAVSRGSG